MICPGCNVISRPYEVFRRQKSPHSSASLMILAGGGNIFPAPAV